MKLDFIARKRADFLRARIHARGHLMPDILKNTIRRVNEHDIASSQLDLTIGALLIVGNRSFVGVIEAVRVIGRVERFDALKCVGVSAEHELVEETRIVRGQRAHDKGTAEHEMSVSYAHQKVDGVLFRSFYLKASRDHLVVVVNEAVLRISEQSKR